jgi:two-component system response regulator RstA
MDKPHTVVNHHILLVEDDARLSALIQEYLEKENMRVAIENRGDLASKRIINEQPDLVILDLMLPGRDGLEICKDVRPHFSGPILMLTALAEDIDQVVGLELGADDYVTKPVMPRVLLARIRSLLRRANHEDKHSLNTPEKLQFGKFRINRKNHQVHLNNTLIDLSTSEFELLWFLALNAGEIVSREKILEEVRGIDYDGQDRSVDVGISRIRKKLNDNAAQPYRVKTIRAKGYLFIADAWD